MHIFKKNDNGTESLNSEWNVRHFIWKKQKKFERVKQPQQKLATLIQSVWGRK